MAAAARIARFAAGGVLCRESPLQGSDMGDDAH
jgi:hypothetical protein